MRKATKEALVETLKDMFGDDQSDAVATEPRPGPSRERIRQIAQEMGSPESEAHLQAEKERLHQLARDLFPEQCAADDEWEARQSRRG